MSKSEHHIANNFEDFRLAFARAMGTPGINVRHVTIGLNEVDNGEPWIEVQLKCGASIMFSFNDIGDLRMVRTISQ